LENEVAIARSRERRVAVFAGRLVSWKGVRLALQALTHPSAREWELRIIGDGPDRPLLEDLVTRWDLRSRVAFTGTLPRDETLEFVRRASAFLFPSLHDSGSWAVAEATALGTPVVALDTAGIRAVTGGRGFLVSPRGSARDVASRLAEALDAAEPSPPIRLLSAAELPVIVADAYRRAAALGVGSSA
jgi:glycosyltransferase involved in cell wall biosynthesis